MRSMERRLPVMSAVLDSRIQIEYLCCAQLIQLARYWLHVNLTNQEAGCRRTGQHRHRCLCISERHVCKVWKMFDAPENYNASGSTRRDRSRCRLSHSLCGEFLTRPQIKSRCKVDRPRELRYMNHRSRSHLGHRK